MAAKDSTGVPGLVDELDVDCAALKASLHVARGAAILKINDRDAIPDKALPDALWAAVEVVERIERKIVALAQAAK